MRVWIALSMAAVLMGCSKGGDTNNSAAADAQHPAALVGRWAPEINIADCNVTTSRGELLEGGAMAFQGRAGTWAVDGDRLIFSRNENGTEFIAKVRYRQEGDRVRLLGAGPNGDGEVFVRCGSPTARALAIARQGDTVNTTMPEYDNAMDPMTNAADAPMMDMNAH